MLLKANDEWLINKIKSAKMAIKGSAVGLCWLRSSDVTVTVITCLLKGHRPKPVF